MGIIVVVDDIRVHRDPDALHFTSAREAIAGLQRLCDTGKVIDELWLDYWLEPGNTVPIAEWLVKIANGSRPIQIGTIYIHTMSPDGARKLCRLLRCYFEVKTSFLPEYNPLAI